MRINADSFVSVGICILGLVGVGYAIGVHSKMKVMCDRLDTSIDNLANNTEIDIPAKVIDQAVQKAVERESYSAVKRATEEVVADAKREIESRVGTAVKAQYDAISDGVADQIAKNVARIDESKLKKEVVQKATGRSPRNSTINWMTCWRSSTEISRTWGKSINPLRDHFLRRIFDNENQRDHEICEPDLQQGGVPASEEEP